MQLLGLLLLMMGMLGAMSVAAHAARQTERFRPVTTRADIERRRAATNLAVEVELRRSQGIRRLHTDPEHAPVVRKARVRRQ
jgi:hypothetical protein